MEIKLSIIFCVLAASSALANEESRIIGGDPAPTAEYPYQVSLRINGVHFCGGSIVNKNTILTSAFCIHGKTTNGLTVLVGTTKQDSEKGVEHETSRLIPHPAYNQQTSINDVAIVKLRTNITYNMYVQPVSICKDPPFDNERLLLTGWGLTSYPAGIPANDLQCLELQSLDRGECRKFLQGTQVITEGQLCTKSPAGEGSCQGDFGGPLINSLVEQVGIASWGMPCATGLPDVYTNVAFYRVWILNHAMSHL